MAIYTDIKSPRNCVYHCRPIFASQPAFFLELPITITPIALQRSNKHTFLSFHPLRAHAHGTLSLACELVWSFPLMSDFRNSSEPPDSCILSYVLRKDGRTASAVYHVRELLRASPSTSATINVLTARVTGAGHIPIPRTGFT